jgi:solute carrier family 35 (UDP-sugar transporter), member A1/2/3
VQGILTAASKTNGEYAYNFATIPLFAECLKFCISFALLRREQAAGKPVKATINVRKSLLYVTPSLIYLLHNNVQFFTLRYLDPATYQVLGNLKIVTTGLLFWLFLGRLLSKLQWISLVLLTFGATVSQARTHHLLCCLRHASWDATRCCTAAFAAPASVLLGPSTGRRSFFQITPQTSGACR